MNKKKAMYYLALVVIALGLSAPLFISIFAKPLSSLPTISGYQGVDFIFDSVYFKDGWYDKTTTMNPNYKDYYDTSKPFTVSARDFGDRLNFDPDSSDNFLPNLHMEQMGFTADRDFTSNVYTWNIKIGETQSETIYKRFEIHRFKAVWEANIWLDGSGNEAYPDAKRVWQDAEIWIRVIPNNFQYVVNIPDNPTTVYIAPVYMAVDNAAWFSGKDDPNQAKDPSQAAAQDIFPEQRGVALGFYKTRRGVETDVEDEILSYQGLQLNPDVFRGEYWIRIGVDRFHADSNLEWGGLWGWNWKYPSLHLEFTIHVFVVGEWEVRLYKDEVPNLAPHPVDYYETGWTQFINGLLDFANSPLGWLFGLTGIFILIVIILAVTGVLTPLLLIISSFFFGKKASQKKRGR